MGRGCNDAQAFTSEIPVLAATTFVTVFLAKFRSVKLHEFLMTGREKLVSDTHIRIPAFPYDRAVLDYLEYQDLQLSSKRRMCILVLASSHVDGNCSG